jgi:hypothetical protein
MCAENAQVAVGGLTVSERLERLFRLKRKAILIGKNTDVGLRDPHNLLTSSFLRGGAKVRIDSFKNEG